MTDAPKLYDWAYADAPDGAEYSGQPLPLLELAAACLPHVDDYEVLIGEVEPFVLAEWRPCVDDLLDSQITGLREEVADQIELIGDDDFARDDLADALAVVWAKWVKSRKITTNCEVRITNVKRYTRTELEALAAGCES